MITSFISGANRGIGLEIVKQCLNRGDQVLASCREPQSADALIELQCSFNHLKIYPLNVVDEASVSKLFANLMKEGNQIDFLFNNAGVMDWSDFSEIQTDSFRHVLEVNLLGAFLVMRHSLSCLKRSKNPLVINLSSRLGSIGLRGNTSLGGAIAYQCSKSGLNMLTKQTSLDLSKSGIRVISQSPGWVKTDMGGKEAKYEVSESVRLMLRAIDLIKPDTTGTFIGEDGQEIPW